MIANVTYGYTAASFSGRMPCVEIADAIVQTGRQILEQVRSAVEAVLTWQAIRLVEGTADWNAKVVYGDTDSLFVLCRGASRERAFQIGQAISEAVTKRNLNPIKLNFEKVVTGKWGNLFIS